MSSSGTDDREPAAADEPDAAIGFTRVDAQPDTATLIEGMDATAQWPAVKHLRACTRWRHTAFCSGAICV